MRIEGFTFGSIQINGMIYERDVVIGRGKIRKRNKSLRSHCGTPTAIRRSR
jgi:hypothetical protein